jgi:Uma2 family endonuclease
MSEAATRRATYADVLAAPAQVVAEVLFGVLHTHPRPSPLHARASSRLGVHLGGPFDLGHGGPGGWVILDEPELHLGTEPDIVVPDLAGWRRERLPAVPSDVAYFELAPNWVCEVLSPATEAADRADKMEIYCRESIAHVWLIDPIDTTLEVYRLEGARWVRIGAWRCDAVVRAEPFETVELPLALLWAR